MWKYRKEEIPISDTGDIDIIDVMNDFAVDGWETFSVSLVDVYQHTNGKITKTYLLFMKRCISLNENIK